MVDPNKTKLSGDEARAGATPHMTRVILPVSLLILIVIFAVLVIR